MIASMTLRLMAAVSSWQPPGGVQYVCMVCKKKPPLRRRIPASTIIDITRIAIQEDVSK